MLKGHVVPAVSGAHEEVQVRPVSLKIFLAAHIGIVVRRLAFHGIFAVSLFSVNTVALQDNFLG